MILANKLKDTSGVAATPYVDDVFEIITRTGVGSTSTTINTKLSTLYLGCMIWIKSRDSVIDHAIYDSARGATFELATNSSAAQTTQTTGLNGIGSDTYTLGSLSTVNSASGYSYVDWVFKKAPKFFDVVTWTGNGVADRVIPHSLAASVGMLVIKRTDTTANWWVFHRGGAYGFSGYLSLNSSAPEENGSSLGAVTDTSFTIPLSGVTYYNASGGTYVAYFFAHDPSADGIIQCGSYAGNGSSTGPVINLGWEPQYLMIKKASGSGDWVIMDYLRDISKSLTANRANTEASSMYCKLTATGFDISSSNSLVNSSDSTYIYMTIRRSNKPPTVGTQVYNAIARTGTGAAATVTGVGFAPDLIINQDRTNSNWGPYFTDRLRGHAASLCANLTDAENATSGDTEDLTAFLNDGASLGTYNNNPINIFGLNNINHFFKRAPGVFDVVCYTGTGVAHSEAHSLGVVPELMIIKPRSAVGNWKALPVYPDSFRNLELNSTAPAILVGYGSTPLSSAPTASSFALTIGGVNSNAVTYVAYLFATKAGISKVGSYTGNGSTQTINCGFTTGARFILIKRTDSTGDWYVWDTVRGIVSGNDPHLSLNSTAAEVTSNDSIDPESTGFIVNQVAATNINVTSATYIYLAIA